MTVSLNLSNISAHYGQTKVLDDLSLHIKEGELVSLLGASGCGKTTTLRLVAGFLRPSSGEIKLGDRDLTQLPAHKRNIGLVFQTYALFPHLSVIDNVAFGLKQRGLAKAERLKRTQVMLERVGLKALAHRYPSELSGGQRQRVALARALVIDPPLLMFDEPLSNLDAKLRVDMRVEIRRLQQANGTTALYVTHDQEEAFSISDRVAIMNAGKVMQLDTPEVLYARPANRFVANFVGFVNMINMQAQRIEGDTIFAEAAGGIKLRLPHNGQAFTNNAFTLVTRPEGLEVRKEGQGIPAKLSLRTYLGRSYQYRATTDVGELIANGPISTVFEPGENVVLVPQYDECHILSALD